MLPNFLCIGAQKCGTTTLWHLLNAHPDIYMASPRETRFFSEDTRFADGLPAYEINHFSAWNGERAIGEKCPEYLYLPQVPQRLFDSLGPDLRLLICLRSPAARAYSHYRHNVANFRESRSFEEAISEDANLLANGDRKPPPFGYLARGLYGEQIERYLDVFNKQQCHFIDFDELTMQQSEVTKAVYDFLGVSAFEVARPVSSGRPPAVDMELQSSDLSGDGCVTVGRRNRPPPARPSKYHLKRWVRSALGRAPTRRGVRDNIFVRRPSESLRTHVERINRLGSLAPTITAEDELRLNRTYFADDIEKLKSLVPFDVSGWLKTNPVTARDI